MIDPNKYHIDEMNYYEGGEDAPTFLVCHECLADMKCVPDGPCFCSECGIVEGPTLELTEAQIEALEEERDRETARTNQKAYAYMDKKRSEK